MTPMTPMDAQLILDGAEVSGEDLGIGYRRALETVAGMREEWGVEMETSTGWCRWLNWFATRKQAVNAARLEPNPTRLIRRYVTEPETTDG